MKRLDDLGFGLGDVRGLMPDTDDAQLRRFQAFHGLEETGILDAPTERALYAPRFCGCPDLMVLEASNNRWPDPHIHWGLANNWPVPMDLVISAITWACQQWEAVCGLRFTYCETAFPVAAKSRMLIKCDRIDGQSGTLAWSELANGRDGQKGQQYDSGEKWVNDERPNNFEIDLGRVACHEIGHFIGIPHIAQGNLLQPMYDVRIRTPQAGDIREAQSRYGPPTTPKPPPGDGAEFLIRVNADASIALSPGVRVVAW